MSWLDRLLDLLFPPKCCFCGRLQERSGICPACEKTLPRTGEEAEQTLEGGLRCASALWYEGEVRSGLLRFKFRGARWEAKDLGALLAETAAEVYSGEFDTVTWTPVSKKRRRERGYDQAELLARSACRLWDTEPVRLLEKVIHNPAQSGLGDASARRANVLGVYDAANVDNITGKRILLVDDICTTGATLSECARVLLDAGATDVMAVTVARGRKKSGEAQTCGGNTQENGTNCR